MNTKKTKPVNGLGWIKNIKKGAHNTGPLIKILFTWNI